MEVLVSVAAAMGFVGLPGIMGFYWIARDLGREDATVAIMLAIYALMLGAILVFAGRAGYLDSVAAFVRTVPPVLGASVLVGLTAGIYRRLSARG